MITVEHLTKYYGDHLAVDDLSFEIADGHVYGFLGPNGAGKSTTMNIITGCLSATEGSVRVDGHDIYEEPVEARKQIGYLPEQPPLYMNETPVDYLRFVGKAKGLRGAALEGAIETAIESTGIENVKHRRIATLSKGYKQRVGIAQAILGDPGVIILDEPTVGLDPLQILEIRDLIRSLGEDHTVIFSSHILSEVQAICDRILMIAGGKLVAFGTPDDLEKQLLSPGEIRITTDAEEDTVRSLLTSVSGIREVQAQDEDDEFLQLRLILDTKDIYPVSGAVFKTFAENGLTLLEMSLKKADLEDIFIELAEGNSVSSEEGAQEYDDTEKEEEE